MAEKEIWIVAEHRGGELREITLEMLREGRKLADKTARKLCAVLLGHHVQNMAAIIGKHGADRVYLAEHPHLEQYSTDGYANVLTELVKSHEPLVIMIGETPYGKDLAPCLAARIKAGLLAGCVMLKINDKGAIEGTRPAYSGKVYSTVSSLSKFCVATIRPGVIGVDKPKESLSAEIVEIQPDIDPQSIRTKVVGFIKADPGSVDLTEAEIIVSGGRGIGSLQQWQLIEKLAQVMGGSVGGSRVAMDEGWTSRERMVGQTGRTVAPRCYIASGISGASAHLNGIKDSKLIIAINQDRTAPIFKMADMGVVGDLQQILPALIEQLQGTGEQAGTGGSKP
ncbi:MAG: electron transfer flavoprotein subunit alpha/FixB family protein [Desulfitobacterium sp.]